MKEIVMPKLNKRRVLLVIGICVVIALLGVVAGVGAKYVKSFRAVQSQLRANEFFFTVDLLGDTQEYADLQKEIHLFGGDAKSLTFRVQNYFDDLRINAKDIRYSVTLSCDNKDYTDYALTAGTLEEHTLTAGAKDTDAYTLSLPAGYAQFKGNTVVTATVKATDPYVKEMKLRFVLHGQPEPVIYRMEDRPGGTYATLIVMASEEIPAGALKLDWSAVNQASNLLQIDTNSKYVLDGTLSLAANDPNGGFLNQAINTLPMQAEESILIYFFKADPAADYSTIGDLVAEKSGGVYSVVIKEHADY